MTHVITFANQDEAEQVKAIIFTLAECLAEYASCVSSLNSEPLYGRDARNAGVEDGWCAAPEDYELQQARENARIACEEAVKFGLLAEIPYDLT